VLAFARGVWTNIHNDLGVIAMSKGTFVVAATVTLGLAAAFLMPIEVTAGGIGSHTVHIGQFTFKRPLFRPHHHHGSNNGLYGGYPGYYYMPTNSYDSSDDITGSVPATAIIPPPPALRCEKSREVVTVPSEFDGAARQITITRC